MGLYSFYRALWLERSIHSKGTRLASSGREVDTPLAPFPLPAPLVLYPAWAPYLALPCTTSRIDMTHLLLDSAPGPRTLTSTIGRSGLASLLQIDGD